MIRKNQVQVVTKNYFHIFPYVLHIIYGKNMELKDIVDEVSRDNKDLNCLRDDKWLESIEAFVYNDEDSTDIYLFLKDSITLDTLLHECIHITSRIFDIMDSKLNSSTEEFFAYITQYMFKECCKVISNDFKLKLKVYTD